MQYSYPNWKCLQTLWDIFCGRVNEELAADSFTNKQHRTFIASAEPHGITIYHLYEKCAPFQAEVALLVLLIHIYHRVKESAVGALPPPLYPHPSSVLPLPE